jgi:YidC/Oxa1 family membrane protein insertase
MNSGRFLLAVVLMIAVMVVTNLIFPPAPREPVVPADSVTPPPAPGDLPPRDRQPAERVPAERVPAADVAVPVDTAGVADTVVVRSPLYEYRLLTRGGSLVGARLLQYEVQPPRDGAVVELASPELPVLFSYRLRTGTREIDVASLPFTAAPAGVVELDSTRGAQTVTLQHASDVLGITLAYGFDPTRYVIDVRMSVRIPAAETPSLTVALPRTLAMNEAVPKEDERALAYVVNSDAAGINSVRLGSVKAQRLESGPLSWVAVKNKYFVTAALAHPEAQRPFAALVAEPVGRSNAANLTATGLLPGPDGTFAFRIYAGPLEPARLEELGNRFEDVNPFGWRLFRPVLQPLGHAIAWVLYGMHDVLGFGYGWVLILFGVLIRVLLWPLNAKAMRSQMKNMELQPKLKEIQAKYKNEPERLQKEMLRLYKEEGFNPMGGCLPMLIPLPILITLFFVFQSTIAFRGAQFLWLPDLSRADPFYILPVLLGASMFLMQWLSTRSAPDQNPQMKFLMYFMPIFMTVIFLNFASGLNLYYTAMNFASIPQQLQIMRERKRFQAARR